MKKVICFLNIVLVFWFLTMSCKSNSYGSSYQMSNSDAEAQFLSENQDCLAWKFYLFTAMHRAVHQGAVREVSRIKRKYVDQKGRYGPHGIDMYKVLPPETAQKIINTIIEKEGGHCSREVLYDIKHCGYHSTRGDAVLYDTGVDVRIKFNYFIDSTDLPMNKGLVRKYKKFLLAHLSKSPESTKDVGNMICVDDCSRDEFRVYYGNNFGMCMLEKHEKYFKNKNIFDLANYFYWEKHSSARVHIPSLQEFIKKTDEVAEDYKEKNQP